MVDQKNSKVYWFVEGLLNAIVLDITERPRRWILREVFAENGLLAKPTHGNIIRFAPPLVMNKDQLHECCDIIEE
jgi:ornithine--oxo-acid transaminase